MNKTALNRQGRFFRPAAERLEKRDQPTIFGNVLNGLHTSIQQLASVSMFIEVRTTQDLVIAINNPANPAAQAQFTADFQIDKVLTNVIAAETTLFIQATQVWSSMHLLDPNEQLLANFQAFMDIQATRNAQAFIQIFSSFVQPSGFVPPPPEAGIGRNL
jgi:hypothetical protein